MVASDHPAGCGTAARLPNRPGNQKLTPPSSAAAIVGAPIRAPRRRMKCLNCERNMPHPPERLCVAWHQFNGVGAARANVFAADVRIFIICGAMVTVTIADRATGGCRAACFTFCDPIEQ